MDPNVRALARAADVLGCFSYEQPELGVAEISRRLGLPTSTVHRLLVSLHVVGFVERPTRGRYRLGLRLHELGQTATFGNVLRHHGHRHLEALRSATGHTPQLAVLSGTDAVYIDRLEDSEVFRRFGLSGSRIPAYASSSGKVLLAFGAADDSLRAIAAKGLVRRAERTITSMTLLLDELEATRRRGYAESLEETWPDMASVAAPVLGVSGRAVASLSVAGPVGRFDPAARARAARLVQSHARRLAAELEGVSRASTSPG
jgi:DNA-binding IclR family transcriptional regulator